MELINKIKDTYKNILISRFNIWKVENNHAYQVLKFAKENISFSFDLFKKKFKELKNPRANIDTFCHESQSDKGIFFYFNRKYRKFFFPNFIIDFLNI